MIHFEWPWVLAALPLPLLVRWMLSPVEPAAEAALRVPHLDDFAETVPPSSVTGGARGRLWLALLAWLLLTVAAARPQWQGDLVELPVSGRDLMLAVDISGSMEARDFRLGTQVVERLFATKQIAMKFIARREGDRIGLILFGRQAYLQTPLTFDRETVMTLLDEAQVGFAGKETAIGDAIGLALKHLRERPAENRVLILLTDGANTAGEIDPLKAAQLSATEGLKIYTIGIGSDRSTFPYLVGRSFLGSELDEQALQQIAGQTGGRYFRARDARELAGIYAELDELEPVDHEVAGFRPRRALFYWPLAGALGLAGLLAWSGVRGPLTAS